MSGNALHGIDIRVVDPVGPDASRCLDEYLALLRAEISPDMPDFETAPGAFAPPDGVFLVAFDGDQPVGCAGLRQLEPTVGEVKRMWVAASRRGSGLGQALLEALEEHARQRAMTRLLLDTNDVLHRAIAFYRRNGYDEIERYNDNPWARLWFAKEL